MNVLSGLARKGHQLLPPHTFFGGGQAIFIHPEYNTLIAGSEPTSRWSALWDTNLNT